MLKTGYLWIVVQVAITTKSQSLSGSPKKKRNFQPFVKSRDDHLYALFFSLKRYRELKYLSENTKDFEISFEF